MGTQPGNPVGSRVGSVCQIPTQVLAGSGSGWALTRPDPTHLQVCSQLQLLTSDSLLFWLKTAHSAANRSVLELELELASALAVKFSKYISVYVSIASSFSHVASSLLLLFLKLELEHEMSLLSLKYCMYHIIKTVKTL